MSFVIKGTRKEKEYQLCNKTTLSYLFKFGVFFLKENLFYFKYELTDTEMIKTNMWCKE